MQDKSYAEQIIFRTNHMQNKSYAEQIIYLGQIISRTNYVQNKSYLGQIISKTNHMNIVVIAYQDSENNKTQIIFRLFSLKSSNGKL